MAQTFGGYRHVLRDTAFVWFLGASVLMVLVYMQMNTTLAVYLRDTHGVSVRYFGYILSLNAGMVVLFQFPIARWISKYRPLIVMAVGTGLYAVGFGMYGLVSTYGLFLLAMVIITIGEMFVAPVGQAIVTQLAPEDMRGRYMAVFGFSWVIPAAVGPLLAGLVMDNADPRWVWYAAGIIGVIATGAYYLMKWQVDRSTWTAVDQRLNIMEMLEEGEISAEEAVGLMQSLEDKKWAKLAAPQPTGETRYLRIQVSDLASGIMKTDLRLPLGLVNTVLYVGGRLAADLDDLDSQALRELIAQSTTGESVQTMDVNDDEQIQISWE
jgi:MFS family permease